MATTTGTGLLSNVLRWISFPSKSSVTLKEWAWFLAIAVLAAFLWSRVTALITSEGAA